MNHDTNDDMHSERSRRRARWSARLFTVLVACFPASFRDRFAPEMYEVFADQLAAARAASGMRGVVGLWLRTIPAMARAGLSESAAARRETHITHTSYPPRGERMLETVHADLRFALRTFRKSPVFALVCILCISIGAGAVTTIFSAMNALLLRPLPGATDAGALVRMERKEPGGTDGVSASYPLYEEIRARTHTLDGVAAWGKTSLTLRTGSGDDAAEVYGNFVSGNFFDVLRVHPERGRFFLADEDRTELTHPVIVLSDRIWRTRLNADPDVIGRTIGVNGHSYTVVGIAPAEFEGLDAPIRTDAWLPLMMQAQIRQHAGPLSSPNVTWLRLCGRLRDGVSRAAAHQELAAITAQYVREVTEAPAYPKYSDMQLTTLTGLPPDASGPLMAFLSLLLGAAALVLLIASVNVASMLSARAVSRRREMAVRAALGASRSRLVRQLLTEILALFALGAAGGVALACVATAALEHVTIPGSLSIALHLSPDWRVTAFALLVSLVAGLTFGLAPALQAASRDIAVRMRDAADASGTRRTRASSALVVGQLSLSLLLLVAASLFVRALNRGNHIDVGFDEAGVATVSLNTESWGYDDAKGRAFYKQLRDEVASIPGVTAVSYAGFLPLTLQSNGATIQVAGVRADAAGVFVRTLDVGADYFSVVKMPIVAGRQIEAADDERAPNAVVVNEAFVRQYWPGQNAVGRTIGYQGATATVVGVARDAKYSTLTETMQPFAYFPLAQNWDTKQTLLVRTAGDPLAIAPELQRIVRSIDERLPIPAVSTLRHEDAVVLVPQRIAAMITGVLGAVGLVLAVIGLYGVIAYSSSRRRREIGIRLALGARRGDVLQMILKDGVRLTAAGIGIGLVLAAIATRLLVRVLFGVSPLDGVTFLLTSAMLGAVAIMASYLPARRASGANPMSILRGE